MPRAEFSGRPCGAADQPAGTAGAGAAAGHHPPGSLPAVCLATKVSAWCHFTNWRAVEAVFLLCVVLLCVLLSGTASVRGHVVLSCLAVVPAP